MPALTLRRTLRLTVTLLGLDPAVWRELVIDGALNLSELHTALSLALDWPTEAHHVFTDTPPLYDDGDVPAYRGYGRPRRWGDRWTMIEWRDPDVIDAGGVESGALLTDGPLYYGSEIAGMWWCRVDAVEADVEPHDRPIVRLVAGDGRAPLPGGPDRDELRDLHAILADPSHPDHTETAADFAAAVGPWTAYGDVRGALAGARDALASRFEDRPRRSPRRPPAPRTRLDALLEAAPPAARGGLWRHVRDTLDDPTDGAVDAALSGDALKPFLWLLSVIGEDGAPLVNGFLAPHLVAAGGAELGWSESRLRMLVAQARDLRLVRRFRGRLVMLVDAAHLRSAPAALWEHLAGAVWRIGGRGYERRGDHRIALALLAIADGTLSDPQRGEAFLGAALAAFDQPLYSSPYGDMMPWAYGTGRRRRPADGDPLAAVGIAELLGTLGLQRSSEGYWLVSPALRAFARDALAQLARLDLW